MRKIRIIEQVSLDGVIQAPGGGDEGGDDYAHGGWAMLYADTAIVEAIVAAQGRSFDLLLGRRTYDIFAGYWPKVENDPIADGLNAATKYVATHRPDSLGWGPVEALGADIMEGVRAPQVTVHLSGRRARLACLRHLQSRIAAAIISSLGMRRPSGVEVATIAPFSTSRFNSFRVKPRRSAALRSATVGRGLRKMRRMLSGEAGGIGWPFMIDSTYVIDERGVCQR